MKTRHFSQVVSGLLLTLLVFCAFGSEVMAAGAHPGSQDTKKVYPWFVYGNDYTISGPTVRGRQIYSDGPQDVKGTLPVPKWLFYEKLNMYVYDALDGQKHIYYASDGESTEKLLGLLDRFGITKVGYWHFSSMSKPIWKVTKDWAER